MSLSDILKKTLTIDNKNDEVNNLTNNNLDKSVTVVKKSKSSIPSLNIAAKDVTIFTDLKDETLEKIKNNPFWDEYSMQSKEKMVSKYFDNKVKRSNYNNIKYNLSDKKNFIEEVLRSVV